jgi:hypothetical protein
LHHNRDEIGGHDVLSIFNCELNDLSAPIPRVSQPRCLLTAASEDSVRLGQALIARINLQQ